MDREIIAKKIKIFGGLFFIILSIIEFTNLILLLSTPINLNGTSDLLILTIFNFYSVEYSTSITWLFVFIIGICFIILGLYIIKFSTKKLIDYTFSKHMFFIGILILIISIIKMNLLYLIQISEFKDNGGSIAFVDLIQDLNYMPAYSFYLWNFFIIPCCYEIIFSIVMSAAGLNWFLTFKESKQILHNKNST